MDDLIAFVRAAWDARCAQLDEDERVALEASRCDADGFTPTGEHWHWVESEHDQVLTLDPMLDEYINDGSRAALRSVEEYPTSMSFTLPHFVVSYAEETRTVDAMHIARWDPARVLAEVELERADVAAKRRILELHAPFGAPDWPHQACRTCGDLGDPVEAPCETVRLLAQPYAGQPGWRAEWAA